MDHGMIACPSCGFKLSNTLAAQIRDSKSVMQPKRSELQGRWTKECVVESIEAIEKLYEGKGAISGMSTGFRELDQLTDGLHRGEMIVLAGRPRMGKTALVLNIVEHTAINSKAAVVIFTLDVSANWLTQRILCSMAKIDLRRVSNGFATKGDFQKLADAATTLVEAPLFIDDTSELTVEELGRRIRHYVTAEGVKLAVIDYVQLLRFRTCRGGEHYQPGIGEVSIEIKKLARELEIPIIVLARLDRNVKGKKSRRRFAKGRDSECLGQDADVVMLIVRDEYYADTEKERKKAAGKTTLIVAKQRNGPTGDVRLSYKKDFMRFLEPK